MKRERNTVVGCPKRLHFALGAGKKVYAAGLGRQTGEEKTAAGKCGVCTGELVQRGVGGLAWMCDRNVRRKG